MAIYVVILFSFYEFTILVIVILSAQTDKREAFVVPCFVQDILELYWNKRHFLTRLDNIYISKSKQL